jgi:hypothetical protein
VLGSTAAVISVNLFPLVKYITGVPACTIAGSGYPQALYYIYIAVLVSSVTVPLGFRVGRYLKTGNLSLSLQRRNFNYILTPAVLIFCLTVIMILRLS